MASRLGNWVWQTATFVAISTMVVMGLLFWLSVSVWQRANYLNDVFQSTAQRSVWSIGAETWTGFQSGLRWQPPQYRWLILGTDEVQGSGRSVVLTDTMMVVTYRPEDATVRLLSLPRDLYHPGYATKINALYAYGQQRNPQRPTDFPEEVIEDMLGEPIDTTLVLSLADVQELIDTVGGVEVNVPHGFVDERFPRSGVDVTVEDDPAILYETIEFVEGEERMSGERALKYMRSRKSVDPEEGTDEARARRQQQVIAALVQRLQSPTVIGNPAIMGSLYRWYADRYITDISLFQLGGLGAEVWRHRSLPDIVSFTVPLTNQSVATESATLLVHPPTEKYDQWVYEPEDPTWEEFRAFIDANRL